MCYGSNYAEISELFVKEEFRRMGIGKALLKRAEHDFADQNVKGFQLLTGSDNLSARKFYEAMGYQQTQELFYRKRI